MKDLFAELNTSQQEAVAYCDGPQMVIAGAGSGKTRVLTYKIAYLLQQGIAPWNILALTFTNKAAREMKERIGTLVGHDIARRLNMGTFHSVFSRILRTEAGTIGYDSNYTIYDENDSRSLIKAIVKELGLDEKVYKPASVHGKISMAKNHLIGPEGYTHSSALIERDKYDRMPKMSEIYRIYDIRCRAANAMDFDDLLVMTFRLFRDNPAICDKYQERFAYVLVDEYQDTNYVQQCIVQQLTARRRQLCVVGDDAQSIYAFRGANIDNMLDFKKAFGEFRTFKLEQNYRSTQAIVKAANSLIAHNRRQIKKNVFSENEPGDRIVFRQAFSDKEEVSLVCKDIQRLRRKEHCEYGDFCILYRTNAQSRNFEEEMRRQSIPYRIYGGVSFYQRKEIKDIIAYFRLVVNPDDEEALLRIINYPARGIGQTTLTKLRETAHKANVSIWEVMEHPQDYALPVTKSTLTKLSAFHALIASFVADRDSADAYTLGTRILLQSGIQADLMADNTPEGQARQENLGEFESSLRDFVDTRTEEGQTDETFLSYFIQETSLLTDQDSDKDEIAGGRVSLMTVHASKGLEFPTVFVVGLEENIFPGQRSLNSPRELEEERRLLYVAITRAEKHCILSCAKNRYMYGNMSFNAPSRFVGEIDSSLIDCQDDEGPFGTRRAPFTYRRTPSAPQYARHNASPAPSVRQSSFTGNTAPAPAAHSAAGSLAPGTVVEHQRFGRGTVIRTEGSGENEKATVQFQNTGIKQLLLKFARLKVVE